LQKTLPRGGGRLTRLKFQLKLTAVFAGGGYQQKRCFRGWAPVRGGAAAAIAKELNAELVQSGPMVDEFWTS